MSMARSPRVYTVVVGRPSGIEFRIRVDHYSAADVIATIRAEAEAYKQEAIETYGYPLSVLTTAPAPPWDGRSQLCHARIAGLHRRMCGEYQTSPGGTCSLHRR